jgi:hypothetical protein
MSDSDSNSKSFADQAGNFYTAYVTAQAASEALVASLADGEFHNHGDSETLDDYDEFTVMEYIAEYSDISYFYVDVGHKNGGTHTNRSGFNDFVATNGKTAPFSDYKNFDCDDRRSKFPIASFVITSVESDGGQLMIDSSITLYSGEKYSYFNFNEIEYLDSLQSLGGTTNGELERALGENYREALAFELEEAAKAEYGDLETLLAAAKKA